MRRIHFLVAVRSLAALDAIPSITVGQWGNGWALRVPGQYPDSEFMLRHLHSFVISGTTWHLVWVMAVGTNWRLGARLFRLLARARIAAPGQFRGPWTAQKFKALFPAVAAKLLRATDKDGNPIGPERLPLVWAGEEPVAHLAVEYAPTDSDCTGDVEPPEPAPVVSPP